MVHQLRDHDSTLAKHRQQLVEASDVLPLGDQQSVLRPEAPAELPLEYRGIGAHFLEGCVSAINEEPRKATAEDQNLNKVLDLATALAEMQNKLGEFAPETLKK